MPQKVYSIDEIAKLKQLVTEGVQVTQEMQDLREGLGDTVKAIAQELDIKAAQEQARQSEAEDKLNLERSKMLQAKEIAEDKMEQNDQHQKLRASVSLAKDGIKEMKASILEKRSD